MTKYKRNVSVPSNKLFMVIMTALLGLLSPACGSAAASSADTHDAATTTPKTGSALALELPNWTNEGPAREVQVLFQDGSSKVAAIALRRGTPLPEHNVDSRISVQVLRGSGELSVSGATIPVQTGSLVIVGAQAPHAMQPATQELVVLLVHYFGT